MSGYAICLKEWLLDKDIKNEISLLGIISSLCAIDGYCDATNTYFANLFETDETTISKKLKKLADKNYISIEYKKRGCEILERKITLPQIISYDWRKCQPTIGENAKGNNNNISPDSNIIINNNILSAPKGNVFRKPTTEDVKSYCEEKGFTFDPEAFIAYYDSNGWMVGKQKMKNWKAACVTWQRNGYGKKKEETKEFYW